MNTVRYCLGHVPIDMVKQAKAAIRELFPEQKLYFKTKGNGPRQIGGRNFNANSVPLKYAHYARVYACSEKQVCGPWQRYNIVSYTDSFEVVLAGDEITSAPTRPAWLNPK